MILLLGLSPGETALEVLKAGTLLPLLGPGCSRSGLPTAQTPCLPPSFCLGPACWGCVYPPPIFLDGDKQAEDRSGERRAGGAHGPKVAVVTSPSLPSFIDCSRTPAALPRDKDTGARGVPEGPRVGSRKLLGSAGLLEMCAMKNAQIKAVRPTATWCVSVPQAVGVTANRACRLHRPGGRARRREAGALLGFSRARF